MSESLRRERSHRSDQGEVWEDIGAISERVGARSPTAAALYETHRASLDEYVQAFSPEPGQAGALFALGGQPVGLDLFDSPATLARLLPKLVRSHALDAIDRGGEGEPAPQAEAARLTEDTAAAQEERFPAVGLGEDLRLSGPALTGGALRVADRLVHLCAFRLPGSSDAVYESRRAMPRASARRRGRE